jgi:hypothetical protein
LFGSLIIADLLTETNVVRTDGDGRHRRAVERLLELAPLLEALELIAWKPCRRGYANATPTANQVNGP